jgi:hypothetical protein
MVPVRGRLHFELFKARVAEARRKLYMRKLARLADPRTEAVGVLRALMVSGPPSVKLGAARAVLEMTPRWRDHLDLEEWLAALKDLLPHRSGRECASLARRE